MNKDTQSWSNSNLTEMEELLQKVQQLETENTEINEKLEAKRNTIKSLCEQLDGLRIISIENQRLTIENKHLQEGRPQSELDAAHLAAENAMLNANLARYISATQNIEKENKRLASMVRELQDGYVAMRSLVQHWYKLVPENIRSSIEDAQKETKP